MKDAARSYLSFHRSQRLGIIILMSLLLILLGGLAIMHFGSKPIPAAISIHDGPLSEDSTSGAE